HETHETHEHEAHETCDCGSEDCQGGQGQGLGQGLGLEQGQGLRQGQGQGLGLEQGQGRMFDQVAMKSKIADEVVKGSKPYLRKQIPSINLTPVQREEITKLELSLQEEGVDLRTQLMKGRIELKKLWLEETPDRSKVYFLIDEMTSIRAEMQKKEINFLLRTKEILTSEQWRKLSREMFGSGLGMRHSVGPHR
ncbi:unnamed protein product, partial [marine sediment metagenome]